MATSIRISGLNPLASVKGSDFLPIVQSGSATSLTTFRTSVSAINAYVAVSGSVISASYALNCLSASHAILSDSASYLYPTILYQTTASWAQNSSNSRFSISSSWASSSLSSISSSFATHTTTADTATNATHATTADNATNAIHATTAITATSSLTAISSSYAVTASYAANVASVSPGPKFITPVLVRHTENTNNTDPYIVINWTTYNAYLNGIPSTATSVILQTAWQLNGPDTFNHIPTLVVRSEVGTAIYTASYGAASGGSDGVAGINQGVYPLKTGVNPTFQYQLLTGFDKGIWVHMVGYYN